MSRLPENLYPLAPGYKTHGTSQEAANAIAPSAETLRDQVFAVIAASPDGMTADAAATKLNRSVLSIRPRVSELNRMGKLRLSGSRGRNASGQTASVWVVTEGGAQ